MAELAPSQPSVMGLQGAWVSCWVSCAQQAEPAAGQDSRLLGRFHYWGFPEDLDVTPGVTMPGGAAHRGATTASLPLAASIPASCAGDQTAWLSPRV